MNSAHTEEFVVALRETIVGLRKLEFSVRNKMSLNYTDLSFYDELRNVMRYRLTIEQRMSTICEAGPATLELARTMIGELARTAALIRGIVMRRWAERKRPDSRGRLHIDFHKSEGPVRRSLILRPSRHVWSGSSATCRPRTQPAMGCPATPAPSQPPHKPRRMGLSSLSGSPTFVLLGALATVGALAWLLKESRSPGPLEADKVVMIVREDDGGSIADQLERAGVIDRAIWLNVLTLLDGNYGALKRGEYEFRAGISMNELENQLIAHRVVMYKLTIPGGLTSEQILQRLRENDVLLGDVKETPREGSLMPDTYYFERGDTRLSILSRMAKMQTKAVEEVWMGRPADLPIKSPDEMVTLRRSSRRRPAGPTSGRASAAASSTPGKAHETQVRPNDRLRPGPGKGHSGSKHHRADLNQSTPYNTYMIDGLPPGPIWGPGKTALEAVANPGAEQGPLLSANGTGGHVWRKIRSA